jgi:hypothetical protein
MIISLVPVYYEEKNNGLYIQRFSHLMKTVVSWYWHQTFIFLMLKRKKTNCKLRALKIIWTNKVCLMAEISGSNDTGVCYQFLDTLFLRFSFKNWGWGWGWKNGHTQKTDSVGLALCTCKQIYWFIYSPRLPTHS